MTQVSSLHTYTATDKWGVVYYIFDSDTYVIQIWLNRDVQTTMGVLVSQAL